MGYWPCFQLMIFGNRNSGLINTSKGRPSQRPSAVLRFVTRDDGRGGGEGIGSTGWLAEKERVIRKQNVARPHEQRRPRERMKKAPLPSSQEMTTKNKWPTKLKNQTRGRREKKRRGRNKTRKQETSKGLRVETTKFNPNPR